MGPDKHSVFYPLRDGAEFNLVLIRPDNLPAGVRTTQGDLDEMRLTFEGWDDMYVGLCEGHTLMMTKDSLLKLISCISSVLKWKLCHHPELEKWTMVGRISVYFRVADDSSRIILSYWATPAIQLSLTRRKGRRWRLRTALYSGTCSVNW